MNYSIYELLFFLFCYSFLGWCAEVIFMAARTGRFTNRGLFNVPFSLSYGVAMDILLLLQPTMDGNYLLSAVIYVVITSAVAQIAGEITYRVTKTRLWVMDERSIYAGRLRGIFYAVFFALCALVAMLLIQPFLFLLVKIMPVLALKIVTLVLSALVLVDFITVFYLVRKHPLPESVMGLEEGLKGQQTGIRIWISDRLWKRLRRAYPNLREAEGGREENRRNYVFAQGLCFDKYVWVFFACALFGYLFEVLFVGLSTGVWMNRSSVIYGPFSIIWGFGGVILTMLLHRLDKMEDRYIFIGGMFIGGTYEYMCSVISEVVFGTVFWDYSDMPFNIGGRTNLLFCIFWGIMSLMWVKILYPRLSSLIERIPPMTGKIVTWVFLTLMVCDLLLSGIVLLRYVERCDGVPAENAIDEFLDYQYSDDFVEFVWPNMHLSQPDDADSRYSDPLWMQD